MQFPLKVWHILNKLMLSSFVHDRKSFMVIILDSTRFDSRFDSTVFELHDVLLSSEEEGTSKKSFKAFKTYNIWLIYIKFLGFNRFLYLSWYCLSWPIAMEICAKLTSILWILFIVSIRLWASSTIKMLPLRLTPTDSRVDLWRRDWYGKTTN